MRRDQSSGAVAGVQPAARDDNHPNPALELWAQVVTHAGSGRPVGIDLRLYRRVSSEHAAAAFSMTAAGFRVPFGAVPELLHKLAVLIGQTRE